MPSTSMTRSSAGNTTSADPIRPRRSWMGSSVTHPVIPALRRMTCRAGITGWVTDEPIHDRRGLIGSADVVFPAELLVIEVDGMAYHGAARFQSDRSRQNRLVTAGYTVLRFTWADLVDRPAMVADQIEAALRRARRARSG